MKMFFVALAFFAGMSGVVQAANPIEIALARAGQSTLHTVVYAHPGDAVEWRGEHAQISRADGSVEPVTGVSAIQLLSGQTWSRVPFRLAAGRIDVQSGHVIEIVGGAQ